MARKGSYVEEPPDCSLTETALIQTGPLKLSAHIAVIDALMNLFIKDTVVKGNRKLQLIQSQEKGNSRAFLLSWINQSCQTLRIKLEDEKDEKKSELPKFEKVGDINDLATGVSLGAMCALYCPSNFSWADIMFNKTNDEESISNIKLVQQFSAEFPAYSFCHLSVEDILNMDISIQTNIECMLADMFSMFELYPIMQTLQTLPKEETDFVVKKSKNIPTLESVVSRKNMAEQEAGVKERLNQDTKSEERGESDRKPRKFVFNTSNEIQQAAGRPSERIESPSYAKGRRSRRNSIDDNQSQISLENIGGSFENLNVLKRNPDKDMKVHSGRRQEEEQSLPVTNNANQQTFDIRKFSEVSNVYPENDHLDNKQLDNKQLDELEGINEKLKARESPAADRTESFARRTSFADIKKNNNKTQNQFATSGIQINFTHGQESYEKEAEQRKTRNNADFANEKEKDTVNAKLNSVRLKLEERRNRIEAEKQKMEPGLFRQKMSVSRDLSETDNSNMVKYAEPELLHETSPRNFQQSSLNDHITEMNSSIQKLAAQQNQIQQMIQNSSASPVNFQSPQRRTWGQPQPIIFSNDNNNGNLYGLQGLQGRPANSFEQFGNIQQDQWGNIIPAINPVVSPQGYYGYPSKPAMKQPYYGPTPYMSPYVSKMAQNTAMSPSNMAPHTSIPDSGSIPFRLHENFTNDAANVKKHVMDIDTEEKIQPRKLHAPVPAPAFDEMAPQNISFIESTSDMEDNTFNLYTKKGANPSETSDLDEDKSYESDKMPVIKRNRSSISSSFKERRKGSNESGTGMTGSSERNSLGNIQVKLTDEEVETLNNMKTEVLKGTGDPSKGFVISFDDETPTKPKPVLGDRKLSKNKRMDSDPVMIMLDMNEGIDSDERETVFKPKTQNLKNNESTDKYGSALWNSFGNSSEDLPSKRNGTKILNYKSDNDVCDSDDIVEKPIGLLIDDTENDENYMAKKREKIILQSLKRKQQAEDNRINREEKNRQKREENERKAEEVQKKKLEDAKRREAILEAHKFKKEQEKAEEEGRHFPSPVSAKPIPKIKNGRSVKSGRVKQEPDNLGAQRKRYGSTQNLVRSASKSSLVDPYGSRPTSSMSNMSLASMGSRSMLSEERGAKSSRNDKSSTRYSRSDLRGSRSDLRGTPGSRRDSSLQKDTTRGSRDSLISRRTYTARRGSNASLYDDEELYYGGSLRDLTYSGHRGTRKSSSTSYLGPGSLPSDNRREYDEGASDISSVSGWSNYRSGGQRLGIYREPASKSNRPIVMNAIEHVVFPGVVNKDTRFRVLEEIDSCDCPHFLILFRDLKCQFRGLYAYYPDTEEVFKIYGTGPKQISEKMIDKFFKYNSGGKKFTQIHTKSLTVTIDAFTIHNSIWLGKKTKLPDRSRYLAV